MSFGVPDGPSRYGCHVTIGTCPDFHAAVICRRMVRARDQTASASK
jgi:hypothetical protein